MSWPPVYALRAADVRVNVTVKLLVSPLASVSDAGDTVVVIPVMPATDALYVAVELPTLVTLRVTVWLPARAPMAMEAPL